MTPQTTTPVTLVLTSRSAVKIAAVEQALADLGWNKVAIIALKAASGVNEQPLGEETLRGADNRIRSAKQTYPDADIFVSIENGLFLEGDDYVDRAVVVVEDAKGQRLVTYSEGVVFPTVYVLEAQRRGFATTTVGQVMAEYGVVEHHDDPHLTLAKKSRTAFLVETTRTALQQVLV